ncbi:lipoprotein LpqH [Nocardia tenerifensis]|uniref:Lipoprotein LpqH n=1 Tax=Nocardia tenerifensis TaxID=228006 RepID=A0A318K1Y5_9NOCA|nr:lipoprotein LpqH [Nocardia tenerifensis]PXX65504.1 lipoprotein LpqH [Nocardia tenerifensis]
MNTKSVTAALVASAAAAALFVTGCSDNAGGSPAKSSAAPAPQATPAPQASGKSTASVDGKAFDAAFTTTCAKQGGTLALALTDAANATYGNLSVSATITGADTVQAVGIAGSKGGDGGQPYAIGFGNGMPGGSATLTKDGNTYKVTGEGVSADLTNPLAGPKTSKFDVTFACSTVVG